MNTSMYTKYSKPGVGKDETHNPQALFTWSRNNPCIAEISHTTHSFALHARIIPGANT